MNFKLRVILVIFPEKTVLGLIFCQLHKLNFQDAVKIMAQDLVRTRRYVKKFMLMKANIQAVSLKIQTLKSQNTMGQAMKGVTRAMQNMNKYYKFLAQFNLNLLVSIQMSFV